VKIRTYLSIAASLAALGTGNVFAESHTEAPVPVAPVNEDLRALSVEEIVTTARKTEESALEVPLAITSFGSAEIDAAQITNLSDVAAMTPGFSFNNFFGEQLATPVIRGVSQIDIFGQPNVAVFIDNIYVSSRNGINFGFLDLERIEVVKGPQSALYGQNAFSGAVNYVSKRPGDELAVDTELTLGSDDRGRARASISGPLIGDTLSGSAAILYDNFGGTYKDNSLLYDQDIGGHEYKALKTSLFWTPTDNLDMQWNVYLADDFIDPPAQDTIAANCEAELDDPLDPNSTTDRLLNYCGELPSVGTSDLGTIGGERGQTRQVWRSSLNIDWDLSFGTLTSLTGVSNTQTIDRASAKPGDADGTLFAYQSTTPGTIPGFFPINNFGADVLIWGVEDDEVKDFSQEFRYQSPTDRSTRFTGGLYYYQVKETSPNASNDGVWVTSSTPDDFGPLCPCFEIAPGNGQAIPAFPGASVGDLIFGGWFNPTPPTSVGQLKETQKTWAAFAAIDQDFGDNWTLRGELRYTDDEKTLDDTFAGATVEQTDSWDYWTGRLSLDWRVTETSLLYTSVANGKKPGGFGRVSDDFDGDPNTPDTTEIVPFDPETNTTYELGYKATFWDERIYLDAAAYYTDWEDIVIRFIVDEVNGKPLVIPTAVETNAGDAEIKGAEFGLTTVLNQYWNVGLGASYTDSKLTKGLIETYADWPSFAPDGNMEGQVMPRQPKWQGNLNATFRAPLSGEWEWYSRLDIMYQDEWFVGLDNEAIVPARFRSNLRAGIDNEKYTIEVWVDNITDNDKVESAFRDVFFSNSAQDGSANGFESLFPWRISKSHPERRTLGVTLRGRF